MCQKIYFESSPATEIETPRQFTAHFGVAAEACEGYEDGVEMDSCLCQVDVEGALVKLGINFEKDDWQDITIQP